MKIVAKDNFARETVADRLIAENVDPFYAEEIADFLQRKHGGDNASFFYTQVPNDYVLWRGMEELV